MRLCWANIAGRLSLDLIYTRGVRARPLSAATAAFYVTEHSSPFVFKDLF